MIMIKNRLDTRIFTQPKNRSNSGDNSVEVYVHDSPIICAFYLHFCLSECFGNLTTDDVVDIVHQTHIEGVGKIGSMRRIDAEESLRQVNELNRRTSNNLKFTINQI